MSDADQHIRFCTVRDGTRIAYAVSGQGAPLVRTANWVSHLEYEWQNEVRRPILDALTSAYTLVRYDQRGCGLSDWNVRHISFDVWVDDLDAVVRATGLRRFALLGSSQGCAIAIAYAARHPERVTHLMLYGGFVLGRLRRDPTERQREEARTLIKLIELGWGRGTPEFRQVFTTQFMPDATAAQQRAFDELQRISTSPENAVRIVSEFDRIDVRALAAGVRAPTLVLHSRGDARVPFEEGRRMAGLIPGARFVPLESSNHVLFATDPAWQRFIDEILAFPHSDARDASQDALRVLPPLTAREQAVLELLAQGRNNTEIARVLALSEKTVRNYVSTLFDKLAVASRSEAIVLAREAGYGFAPPPTTH